MSSARKSGGSGGKQRAAVALEGSEAVCTALDQLRLRVVAFAPCVRDAMVKIGENFGPPGQKSRAAPHCALHSNLFRLQKRNTANPGGGYCQPAGICSVPRRAILLSPCADARHEHDFLVMVSINFGCFGNKKKHRFGSLSSSRNGMPKESTGESHHRSRDAFSWKRTESFQTFTVAFA